jgi:hypothetical protein
MVDFPALDANDLEKELKAKIMMMREYQIKPEENYGRSR